MRATLRDVAKHRDLTVADWWAEWPARTRWWWGQVLREPGQGWLRWGIDHYEAGGGWYDPPEWVAVMPPARRLATWLRYRAAMAMPWHRRDRAGLRLDSLREWSSWFVSDDRRRLWREG